MPTIADVIRGLADLLDKDFHKNKEEVARGLFTQICNLLF